MRKDKVTASHAGTLQICTRHSVPQNATSMKGNAYRKVRRPVVDTLKLDACATTHGGE